MQHILTKFFQILNDLYSINIPENINTRFCRLLEQKKPFYLLLPIISSIYLLKAFSGGA